MRACVAFVCVCLLFGWVFVIVCMYALRLGEIMVMGVRVCVCDKRCVFVCVSARMCVCLFVCLIVFFD